MQRICGSSVVIKDEHQHSRATLVVQRDQAHLRHSSSHGNSHGNSLGKRPWGTQAAASSAGIKKVSRSREPVAANSAAALALLGTPVKLSSLVSDSSGQQPSKKQRTDGHAASAQCTSSTQQNQPGAEQVPVKGRHTDHQQQQQAQHLNNRLQQGANSGRQPAPAVHKQSQQNAHSLQRATPTTSLQDAQYKTQQKQQKQKQERHAGSSGSHKRVADGTLRQLHGSSEQHAAAAAVALAAAGQGPQANAPITDVLQKPANSHRSSSAEWQQQQLQEPTAAAGSPLRHGADDNDDDDVSYEVFARRSTSVEQQPANKQQRQQPQQQANKQQQQQQQRSTSPATQARAAGDKEQQAQLVLSSDTGSGVAEVAAAAALEAARGDDDAAAQHFIGTTQAADTSQQQGIQEQPEAAAARDTADEQAVEQIQQQQQQQQQEKLEQDTDKATATEAAAAPAPAPAAGTSKAAAARSKQPRHQGQRSKATVAAAAAASAAAATVPAARRRQGSADGAAAAAAAALADVDVDQVTAADVRAAVLAAGLPRLEAGPGLLKKDVASGKLEEQVKLQDYHIGDATGQHCKLFKQVAVQGGGKEWVQVSKCCHDCQVQHVPWTCKEKGCRGASICNRCLLTHYGGLYSLAALHASCPRCRGVCTCRKCLRIADHAKLLPPPNYSSLQRAVFGRYSLKLLGPLLSDMLQQQEAEAQSWGYSSLSEVPQEALPAMERPLCDRCGTQIVGLLAHCDSCEWDICSSCITTLRQQQQQRPQAVAAGGGSRKAQPSDADAPKPPVTCSNPTCPSVPAGSCADAQQQQQQQSVCRRDLQSVPGAAELSLNMLLAEDLLQHLGRLQQLSQEYQEPPKLQLSDCPLLPEGQPALLSPSGSELTLEDLQSGRWWEFVPGTCQDSWRRQASSSSCLFTPHIDDLRGPQGVKNGPGAAANKGNQQQQQQLARALFWARWLLGEAIIVRGIKGRIPWDPDNLHRAVRDLKAERSGKPAAAAAAAGSCAGSEGDADDDEDGSSDSARVQVLDCEDFSRTELGQHEFFKGYKHGYFVERAGVDGEVTDVLAMLKIRDWPPNKQFREECQRHFVDFLESLPLQQYTDPRLSHSPLNLASALQPNDNPCDLGPKCYVAYGRVTEADREGDSVTKLHVDMADAVNLLVHTAPGGDPATRQVAVEAAAAAAAAGGEWRVRCGDAAPNKPGYDGAGAVWDICQRGADTAALSSFLSAHAPDFVHQAKEVSSSSRPMVGINPIYSQAFMLAQRHREMLRAETGVELWHFEQHRGEAVFVPAGCPHQVRNLTSCCKVAVDFVSPESLSSALANRQMLRSADLALRQPLSLPPHKREYQEKLQSQLMLLRGVLRAAKAVEDQQQQQQQQQQQGMQQPTAGVGKSKGARAGSRARGQQTKAVQKEQEHEQAEEQQAEEVAGAAAAVDKEGASVTGQQQQHGGHSRCCSRSKAAEKVQTAQAV